MIIVGIAVVGGPADGKTVSYAEPPPSVLVFPVMRPMEVVYIPENAPMLKVDDRGVRYYPCNDGKYRCGGSDNARYVLYKNGDKYEYRYDKTIPGPDTEWNGD